MYQKIIQPTNHDDYDWMHEYNNVHSNIEGTYVV